MCGGGGGSQRGVLASVILEVEASGVDSDQRTASASIIQHARPPPPPPPGQRTRTATPTGHRRPLPPDYHQQSGQYEAHSGYHSEDYPFARYVKGATYRVTALVSARGRGWALVGACGRVCRARGVRSERDRARSVVSRLCNAPPPSPGRKIEREGRGTARAHCTYTRPRWATSLDELLRNVQLCVYSSHEHSHTQTHKQRHVLRSNGASLYPQKL